MRRIISYARKLRHGPMALVALLALSSHDAVAADRDITDARVRDVIEDELLHDGAVLLNGIDVSVADGIATLTGTVSDLLSKERAVSIARTVKGVRSVVDRIEIRTRTPRSDGEIRADVTHALRADPAADSYEVEATVEGGEVTLEGKVDSWQEKALTETVAKSVKGVTSIRSELEVEYDTSRPDFEMKAEIQEALEWDVLVDDGLIDVDVADGKVILSGIVGSAAEKNRAVTDAWVIGINDVEAGGLRVARWARDDELRSHKYVPRSDAETRRAVDDALLRDPRVGSFDVTSQVENGVVTLRGNVDHLKAKRAAEQDARNTVGVLRVENRIRVRPVNVLLDADVRSDVVDALIRDAVVESLEVDVRVRAGRFVLTGEVDSYYDDGVPLYDPYVDLPYHPYEPDWRAWTRLRSLYRSDADIRREIEDELFWSPFVDADEVDVTVERGVATLRGTVDTWWEASAAVENAFEGGAVAVDNDLTVGWAEASSE